MLKYLIGFFILLGTNQAQAQVEMATDLRGEGKIYVVIAIILVILAGFFFALSKLDRRTKRLEKEIEEKK